MAARAREEPIEAAMRRWERLCSAQMELMWWKRERLPKANRVGEREGGKINNAGIRRA